MIGQRASELSDRKTIYNSGCYFMSLLYMAWQEGPFTRILTPKKIIGAYDWLLNIKAMDHECYIKDPQAVVDYISPGRFMFLGKRVGGSSIGEDERAIELWTLKREGGQWRHFVYGTYDPWIRSQTRLRGNLDSYRVFRLT